LPDADRLNALDEFERNGLNEKDVEIDHLKTTVIALDEKIKVRLTYLISIRYWMMCAQIYLPT
jgi:hypothetical protein